MKRTRRRKRGANNPALRQVDRTEELRQRLAQRLPDMLDAAIDAYHRIADQNGFDDPKLFAASQTGAKAALAHIEQLLKLIESVLGARADSPAQLSHGTAEAERLIAAARAAVENEAGTEDTGGAE